MRTPTLWQVIVPMKDIRRAKSRLGIRRDRRRELAIAMARDTLCAVANASCVERVILVCQNVADIESFSMTGVVVVVREALGINEAIVAGAEALSAECLGANIAVLPGDLPYLQPTELDVALVKAAALESACVADRSGTGTTLLTARAGHGLNPAYGAGSLQAHQDGGAVELSMPVWSGLRCDVDEPGDLVVNASLGCETRAALERRAEVQRVLESKGA